MNPEIFIKKSKFISIAYKINCENEALGFLEYLAKKFNDATHICFAYKVDNIERCFDDGEPSGTAGKPILNVIKQKDLTNILIVVIRYFGGIKLGSGGLTRAYNQLACQVINDSEIIDIKEVYNISFHINYDEAFHIYVLTNSDLFSIKQRVGNDFIIQCDLNNYNEVLSCIKKYHISNLEAKIIKV